MNTRGKEDNVSENLNDIKTVGGLIDYIPRQTIKKIAFVLLILWTITPIIIMGYGFFARINDAADWVTKLNQMNKMTINWYRILLQISFLGGFLAIVAFAKSIRDARKADFNIKSYIKERLLPISLFIMLIWTFISYIVNYIAGETSVSLVGGDYRKEGLLMYVAFVGMFLCAYLVRDKKYIKWLLKLQSIVALVLSLLHLINNDSIDKLFGLTENSAVFFNKNHYAYYICMSAMCALFLFVSEEKSKIKQGVSLIIFTIIVASLSLNGSLGPYIATACALISSLILGIWLSRKHLPKILIGLGVFILVTIVMNMSRGHLYSDLQILGNEFYMIFGGEDDLSGIGSGRGVLWEQGMLFIKERPIFGCGPAALSDLYEVALGRPNRPHNEFIEYGAVIGIPGLIFYVIALFVYLKEFFDKRKNLTTLGLGLLCVVIAYLVSSLAGVKMYHSGAFFFMFFGLSAGIFRQTARE